MATRTVTIVCRAPCDFDVFEGETFSGALTWDEMLGTVAELTHPKIGVPRYRMWTVEEMLARRERAHESRLAAQP